MVGREARAGFEALLGTARGLRRLVPRPARRELAVLATLVSLRTKARAHGLELGRSWSEGIWTITVTRAREQIRLSPRHAAYTADLVSDFSYYFDAVEPVEVNGSLIVDYSRPRWHRLRPSGRRLFFTALAESNETTNIYLERLGVSVGHTVLDLGAYCGATTWAFSERVGPSGRVIALEPDRANFRALERNVDALRLTNVHALNKGVWSFTGQLEFQGEGNMGAAAASVLDRDTNVYTIDVITLDALSREAGLASVDFVKMDIEGAEIEVLASSIEFLRRFRPRLIIEPHVVHGRLSTEAFAPSLEQAGYALELLPQAGLPLPLVLATPR